jgi:hypothetical protein
LVVDELLVSLEPVAPVAPVVPVVVVVVVVVAPGPPLPIPGQLSAYATPPPASVAIVAATAIVLRLIFIGGLLRWGWCAV